MKENKEKRSRNKYYGDGGGGDGGRLKQSQQRIFLNMKKTKYKRINYISAIRCGFQHLLLGMGCAFIHRRTHGRSRAGGDLAPVSWKQ